MLRLKFLNILGCFAKAKQVSLKKAMEKVKSHGKSKNPSIPYENRNFYKTALSNVKLIGLASF